MGVHGEVCVKGNAIEVSIWILSSNIQPTVPCLEIYKQQQQQNESPL